MKTFITIFLPLALIWLIILVHPLFPIFSLTDWLIIAFMYVSLNKIIYDDINNPPKL